MRVFMAAQEHLNHITIIYSIFMYSLPFKKQPQFQVYVQYTIVFVNCSHSNGLMKTQCYFQQEI